MKRLISILCAVLCLACLSYGQNSGNSIKERKLLAKESIKQLNARATKTARNVYNAVGDIVKKQLAADGREMNGKVNEVWSGMDKL